MVSQITCASLQSSQYWHFGVENGASLLIAGSHEASFFPCLLDPCSMVISEQDFEGVEFDTRVGGLLG
jgi:hypothetical protein